MKIIAFGIPWPQGSKRLFGTYVVKETGQHRGRMGDDNGPKLKQWRSAVEAAAAFAMAGRPPLDGPLRVRMVFTMPKPKSAPKRRQTWPDKKPDIDKIVRSTCDALTKGKAYVDDARIVELTALKVFPNEHPEALAMPGVRIEIEGIA